MMASFTPSSSSSIPVASGSHTGSSALLNICSGLSYESSVNFNVIPLLGTFWQCNPGYIKEKSCKLNSHNSSSDDNLRPSLPPIARPKSQMHLSGADNNIYSTSSLQIVNGAALTNGLNWIADKQFNNGVPNPCSQFGTNISSSNFLAPLYMSPLGAINVNKLNSSEMWPNDSDMFGMPKHSPLLLRNNGESVLDICSKKISTSKFIPKGKIKRQMMYYYSEFRQYLKINKYTKPCSVAVNAQDDIILVDAIKQKVLVFGLCHFEISGCNTISGYLNPCHVAVEKNTGNIIVLEKPPAQQVQIFNQFGLFIRNFGGDILENPRAISVDDKGRIIVVESRAKKVLIFEQNGNLKKQFDCSNHCKFPISVTVNDKREIFICDNRAHCVKVFNYEGVFLRQIGQKGITNYPMAVEINSAGEIVVADNHYGFNITMFTQEGQLVSALNGGTCYNSLNDIAITEDGLVLLANNKYGLCVYS